MAKKHCQPTSKPIPECWHTTWKSCVPRKWMTWALGLNKTYILIAQKSTELHKTKWVDTSTLNNYDKAIVFDTLADARRYVEVGAVLAWGNQPEGKLLPKGTTDLDYALVVPEFEDGALWWGIDPTVTKKSGSFTVKPPSLLIEQKKSKKPSKKNKG